MQWFWNGPLSVFNAISSWRGKVQSSKTTSIFCENLQWYVSKLLRNMRFLSIYSVHSWFQNTQWPSKSPKDTQKTSKDLTVFSVQMLWSWFCSRDMGHRHLCFGFCRFEDFQNHERDKNPCEGNRFHADFFQCFLTKKMVKTTCKFRFLSMRLLPPKILFIT